MSAIKTILVPFDFEEPSYRALEFAKTLADKFGAKVDLLHVIPSILRAEPGMAAPEVTGYTLPEGFLEGATKDARNRLDHVLAGIETKTIKGQSRVRVGDARTEILREAAGSKVDVIVMGTHGRSGVERVLLGSVADRITRTATCPVVTVR